MRVRFASPSSARSASPASATWPGCGSGPCAGPGSRWPTRRGSPPGPSSASGWPCPPGASRWPSISTWTSTRPGPRRPASRWSRCPAGLTGLLPAGIDVEEAAPVDRSAGSLQQLVTSCSWDDERDRGVEGPSSKREVASLLAATSVPIVRERKGRQERDDLRPSVLALAVADARGSAFRQAGAEGSVGTGGRAGHPTPWCPARRVGARPHRRVRPRGRRRAGGVGRRRSRGVPVLDRACRTQQWIERDGIREEPLERRGDTTGADRAAHALERAS